jgi:hypothetical protein
MLCLHVNNTPSSVPMSSKLGLGACGRVLLAFWECIPCLLCVLERRAS